MSVLERKPACSKLDFNLKSSPPTTAIDTYKSNTLYTDLFIQHIILIFINKFAYIIFFLYINHHNYQVISLEKLCLP